MLKNVNFYNETIHGSSFTNGQPVSYLHGNVGDRCKAVIEVEVTLRNVSDSSFDFELSGGAVIRDSGSWFDEGFFPNQIIELKEIGGLGQRQIVKLTTVQDLTMYYIVQSGTFVDAAYPSGGGGNLQVTCIDGLSGVVYRSGLIENSEGTNYASKYNGLNNEFQVKNMTAGTTSAMSYKGQSGVHREGSISAYYKSNTNGVHTVEFSHIFTITPIFLTEYAREMEEGRIPDLLLNDKSLKYVFEAELRFDNNNPNNILTEKFDKYKGTVGWYGEGFNGNLPQFMVDSVDYSVSGTSVTGIKPDKSTRVTIQLTGNFNSNTGIVGFFADATSEYQYSSLTHTERFLFSSLYTKGQSAVTQTDILKFLRFTINSATDATVVMDIDFDSSDISQLSDKFIIGLSLADQSQSVSNTDKTTLLVAYSDYEATTDIEGLLTWASASVVSHPDGSAYTSYRGWPKDGIRVEWSADIDNSQDATVTGVRVGVVARKADGTQFVINEYRQDVGDPPIDGNGVQYFNIDTTRSFNLEASDPFKEVSLVTVTPVTTPFTVEGVCGIKIPWQSWITNPDADTVFVDITQPNNNLNLLTSNYEAEGYSLYVRVVCEVSKDGVPTDYAQYIELDAYPYNEDDNATPQWAVTTEIQDMNGNETAAFNTTTFNTILATFTPDGGDTSIYSDLVAVVRIEKENQPGEAIHELSSVRLNYSGNLLQPTTGNTLLVVTDNGTDVTAECVVDGRKLQPGSNYVINARLFHTYDGALTPLITLDTVVYNNDGTFDIPVTAEDYVSAPLADGRQVFVRVERNSIELETLSGVIGDDISTFTTTHIIHANSFIHFATGIVTNSGTIVYDKLNWAVHNGFINAYADEIMLYTTAIDRGFLSAEDSETVPIVTTDGKGFPYDIEHITSTQYAWADFLTGVRTFNNDTYTELIGYLTDCESVSVDRFTGSNPKIYATKDNSATLYKWDNSNRYDLGQSGIPISLINETFNLQTVYVNNNKQSSGESNIWLMGTAANELTLRWKNGSIWSRVDFSTLVTSISATARVQSVVEDGNGLIWCLCNDTGSLVFTLEYSSGNYYDITNWTATPIIADNGVGMTDGGTAAAEFSGTCKKITHIGYDDNFAAISGTRPNFLISDYGNNVYRELHKASGIAPWEVQTDSYYCGTTGTNTYTFGSGAIEVGSIRGMDYIIGSEKLYGTGEGTPNRVIFISEDYGNLATQENTQLFAGTTGYLEQTAF